MQICKSRKVWEKLFRLTHFPLVSYGWHGNTTINNVLYKCCQMCNRHFNKTPIYSTPGLSCCIKAPVQAPNLYINYRNKLYASTSCKLTIFILEQWQSTVCFKISRASLDFILDQNLQEKKETQMFTVLHSNSSKLTELCCFFFFFWFNFSQQSLLTCTSPLFLNLGTEVTRQY